MAEKKKKNVSAALTSVVILDMFLQSDLMWFTEKTIQKVFERMYGKTNQQRIYSILDGLVDLNYLSVDERQVEENNSPKPTKFYILNPTYAGKLIPDSRVPVEMMQQILAAKAASNGNGNASDIIDIPAEIVDDSKSDSATQETPAEAEDDLEEITPEMQIIIDRIENGGK